MNCPNFNLFGGVQMDWVALMTDYPNIPVLICHTADFTNTLVISSWMTPHLISDLRACQFIKSNLTWVCGMEGPWFVQETVTLKDDLISFTDKRRRRHQKGRSILPCVWISKHYLFTVNTANGELFSYEATERTTLATPPLWRHTCICINN